MSPVTNTTSPPQPCGIPQSLLTGLLLISCCLLLMKMDLFFPGSQTCHSTHWSPFFQSFTMRFSQIWSFSDRMGWNGMRVRTACRSRSASQHLHPSKNKSLTRKAVCNHFGLFLLIDVKVLQPMLNLQGFSNRSVPPAL